MTKPSRKNRIKIQNLKAIKVGFLRNLDKKKSRERLLSDTAKAELYRRRIALFDRLLRSSVGVKAEGLSNELYKLALSCDGVKQTEL